jgi:hypothetical protein
VTAPLNATRSANRIHKRCQAGLSLALPSLP